MSPPKFSSLRSSKRRTASLIPFRDDTSLVAFRYEQTVQAQPPIPIPAPRHPPARSASTSTRTISSNPATPFLIGGHSPPIPPAEEHPALRGDFSSSTDGGDEWKRDSAAPSASSATTIYEEEIDTPALYDKELGLELDTRHRPAVSPAVVEQPDLTESPVVLGDDSAIVIREFLEAQRFACDGDDNKNSPSRPLHPWAAPLPLSSRAILPQEPIQGSPECIKSGSATSPTVPQRRLARSFSFRVSPSTRLKKRSMAEMTTRGSDDGSNNSAATSPTNTHTTTVPTSPSTALFSLSRGMGTKDRSIPPSRGNGSVGTSVNSGVTQTPRLRQSSLDSAAGNNDDAQLPHGPLPPFPKRPATNHGAHSPDRHFSPISISIPTDSLLGDDFMANVSFSKRGSIMFGGKRALPRENMPDDNSTATIEKPADGDANAARPTTNPADTIKATSDTTSAAIGATTNDDDDEAANGAADKPQPAVPRIRVLPADIERESLKVRSLYEAGDAFNWELGAPPSSTGERLAPTPEDPVEKDKHDTHEAEAEQSAQPPAQPTSTSADSSAPPHDLVRREYELAGGAEDWHDVDGADVDRYGFIRPHRLNTPTDANARRERATSRRRNLLTKRDPPELNSARVPGRKVSARSLHTQASEFSVASRRSSISTLRQAANLLPHNRDRRWADEAGEMLTHTPRITHITEDENADRLSEALKQKEWERAEKWRRMAKVIKKGKEGEGMEFEFDTKNPKLIDRTWKGIPDRWRGAAWYSFLATSARANKDAPAEEHLIAEFHRLQSEPCEYDGQIDLDVPRTISQHIMFRRRYRGGQRLLFRVLHAVALYFAETGYVQGMASLAATLLCYFDEEKSFVMMVRMWQLRGLEELYRPGFEGLLSCLKDFETRWLAGKDVAKKLDDLGIDATAFGTRWYLTLFNLSIPFPAQLRIWDVFLLLGGSLPSGPPSSSATKDKEKEKEREGRQLDVLHAAAAALMDALSEIILDSDFDNTMKVLTSWIPVKDEDLLMKVAKAELKYNGKKKG
ncbi:hypothetical protein jhhlp_001429 [Lomentospora prolificans]|uniref:Rab-GAP TBC domain-containing protein n=1 Tax=Lomentospora prolificans TaxID=41688 RepID=A0A2N3NI95_9PEZI|nr:hypothetical protein jhhlp_001429 [Lomentospora prolificans]